MNKSNIPTATRNKEFPLGVGFNNIDKLEIFNKISYELLRKVIEITTEISNICNDMLNSTIVVRWRYF